MAHRLLHTLVVSSTLLLDACGSSPASTNSEPSNATTSSAGADESAASADAESGAASADAESGAASGAYPSCEAGWPTTKGSTCTVDATGVTVCCNSHSRTPDCCVPPQAPPS